MLLFLISAMRAIVEMLGLALVGFALMAVLAGDNRQKNPIYRLFELITRAPRRLVAKCLPTGSSTFATGVLCFILLFICWIALALWRLRLG